MNSNIIGMRAYQDTHIRQLYVILAFVAGFAQAVLLHGWLDGWIHGGNIGIIFIPAWTCYGAAGLLIGARLVPLANAALESRTPFVDSGDKRACLVYFTGLVALGLTLALHIGLICAIQSGGSFNLPFAALYGLLAIGTSIAVAARFGYDFFDDFEPLDPPVVVRLDETDSRL